MDTAVVFRIGGQRLAVHVSMVRRVIWAVEITDLPGQSDKFLGAVNVEGSVIPVANFRHLLKLPPKELELEDRIVIFECSGLAVAAIVDEIELVLHYELDQLCRLDRKAASLASALLKVDGELIVMIDPNDLLRADDLTDAQPSEQRTVGVVTR